jgi:REP element-mobilizing transposase RayT
MRRWYDPSLLHEVAMRTIEGAWWFDPEDSDQRAAILGAMAASQKKFHVRIHAFTFMSNHYHAIYGFDDPKTFIRFLGHFHAAVARLVNDRLRRVGPVWANRPHAVPILDEPEAQVRRLRYVLGQGVRAGVAAHPLEWKGASSTGWLLSGSEPRGRHLDRTARALCNRNLHEKLAEAEFVQSLAPELTVLPCFAHLPQDQWRLHVSAIADEIAVEAVDCLAPDTCRAPGDGAVSKSPPPKRKRPARVHAAGPASAMAYRAARKEFDRACADARLQQVAAAQRAALGKRAAYVVFPHWAFPPAPPWVLQVEVRDRKDNNINE